MSSSCKWEDRNLKSSDSWSVKCCFRFCWRVWFFKNIAVPVQQYNQAPCLKYIIKPITETSKMWLDRFLLSAQSGFKYGSLCPIAFVQFRKS